MVAYKITLFMIVSFWGMVVVAEEEAKCECGVFKSPTAEKTEGAPVVSKAPQFNFQCNADGKESCSNMCKALAGTSKDEATKKICELVGDTEKPFVPLVYYKACNDDAWTYTGLKPDVELCCKAKEVVAC